MKQYLLYLFSFLAVCVSCFSQNRLEVGLKNHEVLYPEILDVKNRLFQQDQLILDDSIKIELSAVDYYQTETKYFIVRDFSGDLTPLSNLVMERVEVGKINVFSYTSVSTTPMMVGPSGLMSGGGTTVNTLYYFEKDNVLKKMTISDLALAMQGDFAALEQLNKAKKIRNAKIGATVLGGLMTVIGLGLMIEETNAIPADEELTLRPNVPFIGGIVIMLVPLLLPKADKFSNMRKAVRTYNRNFAKLED